MALEIKLPDNFELKPKIVVIGVGGAGVNAVNNMIEANVEGVEFWGANTDAQALKGSIASNKIQLGITLTKGLGAGSNPDVGRSAAEESAEQIRSLLEGCNMLFITAGMGGGTGTGAAPAIAKIAKELDILTVAVVTKPFHFEGGRRMKTAEMGLKELEQHVDTLIVIPNQNLFRVANEATTFAEAFKKADNVLRSGVTSITDLIIIPGLINLDFADISTVMSEMGQAVMGTGEADGAERSIKASEAAISNPILDNTSMKGARGVLINITGGSDMTLFEIDEAISRIKEEVDQDANIIFGSTLNDELSGKIRVSVVATGIGLSTQQTVSAVNSTKTGAFIEQKEHQTSSNTTKEIKNDISIQVATTNETPEKDTQNLLHRMENASPAKKLELTIKSIGSRNTNDMGQKNKYHRQNSQNLQDVNSNVDNNNTFDSNNFLMGKGFFIPPKPIEPEECEIDVDRIITHSRYHQNIKEYNLETITNESGSYYNNKNQISELDKDDLHDKESDKEGILNNKTPSRSSIFSKMFRLNNKSQDINEAYTEQDENIEKQNNSHKTMLDTPTFLRRRK